METVATDTQAPKAQGGKKNNKKGGKGPKRDFTALREQQRAQRIARAGEDNVEVVNRKTADAGDLVSLINSFDWGMERLRRQIGRVANVPAMEALAIIEEGQTLCGSINALNERMYAILGQNYIPPRRFRKEETKTAEPSAPAVEKPAKAASPSLLASPAPAA